MAFSQLYKTPFDWDFSSEPEPALDDRSVYLSRPALGKELALQETRIDKVPIDSDTIVVPVPDTGKAAADAMAYELGLPVKLIGVGEGLDDLRPFDPGDFARALVTSS